MVKLPKAPETASARRDAIALVLAIGIAVALNLIVIETGVAAISRSDYTISENATQILTGWGGGIIGILGAVFGYSAGAKAANDAGANIGGGGVSAPVEPPTIDDEEPPV